MLDGHRIGGLLLMGGQGLRFGSDTPKQFHRLSGKPVYLVTLEAFIAASFFDEIVLSCHPDWIPSVEREIASLPIPIRIAPGGATRQESSHKGLLAFSQPPSIVLIHDAVRPFISPEILENNARLAIRCGAVDTCIPSTDTLVYAPDGANIESIPERSRYFRGQTPQSFSYSLILAAHANATKKDASDDCRLAIEAGHPVCIAQGDEHNLKITSELDLFLAEQLFRLRTSPPNLKPANLCGKRYAVVGGTGGIGSAICRALEEAGATPIPLSRSTPTPLDLRASSSIASAFLAIGPIDGLINSAGHLRKASLDSHSLADIETILDVNLKGLILCCQMAQLKPGAHIVNIASSSFARGRKETSVYSASKAAVVNFTQALAEERSDLFVHAVIPQRTRTSMRLKNFPLEDPATLLDPNEVARTVIGLLGNTTSTGTLVEIKHKI